MRKQNTELLGDVMRQVLKQNGLENHLYEMQLIASWESVLGSYVKQYTENLSIRNGILYAQISSAALRHELFLSKSILIDNLNKQVGLTVIKDIRFI